MSSRMSHGSRHAFYTSKDLGGSNALNNTSTSIAYGVLFVLFIYYVLQYLDYFPLLSIPELAWNCLVYLTPSSLVLALDNRPITSTKLEAGDPISYSDSRAFAAKSEAMRHVLGLDGTGIFTRVQRARTITGISTVFKTLPPTSLPGLGNWDNSCYQNSVIQGLASLPSLSEFLNKESANRMAQNAGSTKLALRNVIRKLNDPANAGQKLWTPAELKSMSSWQQQDAQEYFSKVLDEVEKENIKSVKQKFRDGGLSEFEALPLETAQGGVDLRQKPGAHLTPSQSQIAKFSLDELPEDLASILLTNPLEGLLAQRVGCLQCGFVEGLSLIPFNCLTVPLGRQHEYDIRTCLDEYTALESISGVECSKCTLLRQKQQLEQLLQQSHNLPTGTPASPEPSEIENLYQAAKGRLKSVNVALDTEDFSENTLLKKCQIPVKSRVSVTKSRQAVVARLPQALVMHVNRSVFDELSGIQSKNHAIVRFPKLLDLTPWCLGESSTPGNSAAETWNANPSLSMLGDTKADQGQALCSNTNNVFALKAVITHYGRHENGHYICYRKDPHMISLTHEEQEVEWWRLSDDDVNKVNEENVLAQGGVFMLFYERMNSRAPRKTCAEEDLVSSEDPVPAKADAFVNEGKPVHELHSFIPKADSILAEVEAAENGVQSPAMRSNNQTKSTAVHVCESSNSLAATTSLKSKNEASTMMSKDDETIKDSSSQTKAVNKIEDEIPPPSDDNATKENWLIPPPMRTAGAGRRKNNVNRAGNAMSSVSSMVRAN